MIVQTTVEQSPAAILNRIDIILNELLTLRQGIQSMVQQEQPEDFVQELAGSLGPASPDELEYFNTFDTTWQRFDT